jgi:hypothetical protein
MRSVTSFLLFLFLFKYPLLLFILFFFFFLNFFFRSIYSNIKMNFGVSIFSLYNISVLLLVGLTFRRKIDMKYELII